MSETTKCLKCNGVGALMGEYNGCPAGVDCDKCGGTGRIAAPADAPATEPVLDVSRALAGNAASPAPLPRELDEAVNSGISQGPQVSYAGHPDTRFTPYELADKSNNRLTELAQWCTDVRKKLDDPHDDDAKMDEYLHDMAASLRELLALRAAREEAERELKEAREVATCADCGHGHPCYTHERVVESW